jgi:superfamily II DNA or RNA helicase
MSTEPRSFTTTQRAALYLAENGQCAACGASLEPGWHADHQLAFSAGGATDTTNGAALCPTCNLARGAQGTGGSPLAGLRTWQKDALQAYMQQAWQDFLVVATPGAGKTRLAAAVAHRLLTADEVSRVIVAVPTQRLKRQWADAVAPYGVDLDPNWSNGDGALPPGFHGVVVTYAQMAALPDLLRRHVTTAPTLLVLDEVHHCGEDKSWGDAARHAFGPARRRLALSGTPFRSDNNAIPFITYTDGVGTPNVVYDYGRAVHDGVCRPVFFPRRGGRMEWATTGGQIITATFDDALDPRLCNQRLNTALALTGEWVPSVLRDAHAELTEVRTSDPTAGGLVLARDQEHARGIAALLRAQGGVTPVVVVSDEPDANTLIEQFAAGDAPWLVSVRMVSEGVDIPRLRVAVFATNTVTEMFFRQAVGRVVRLRPGSVDETAAVFIPDDPRLRRYAETIREQRDHVIDQDAEELLAPTTDGGSRPASPFQPIAAEATDAGVIVAGITVTAAELAHAAALKAAAPEAAGLPTATLALLLRAHDGQQQRPAAGPAVPAQTQPAEPVPAFRRREQLRAANNTAARRLAYLEGSDFADVNRRLNAAVGVTSIRQATLEQLEDRLSAVTRQLEERSTAADI